MRSWTDQQLIEAVKNNKNLTDVSKALGLTTFGFNSKTIKKYIAKLNLDISHFHSQKELTAIARSKNKNQLMKPQEMIFVSNSTLDRKCIKRYVIKLKLLPYKCLVENCPTSNSELWNNKSLTLHLDHINGDNTDNRLENLRFLCPNCHSQTPTYCGRQLKNKIYKICKCVDCNVSISKKAVRCRKCSGVQKKHLTKIDWPDYEVLVQSVKEIGYMATGRLYGVVGNTVKKHIKRREWEMETSCEKKESNF